MFNRVKAVALKEVKQLLRDRAFLFVLFFFPVFLLVMFGYAVNFDVHHIKLGLYDLSKTPESREIVSVLTSSDYFDLSHVVKNEKEVTKLLDENEVQCVLVIPEDLTEKLNTPAGVAKIQVLVDGVNGNSATIILNYVKLATVEFEQRFREEILSRSGIKLTLPFGFEPVFWFNPDLKSTWFLIPGLIAMILIVTAVVSVALSLVREKERGTIEQINVSSLHTIELLTGKSLPYIVIALVNAVFIIFAGFVLFGLVVKGSYLLLFLTTLIFISASVSIGIFISVIADSQQVAFTISVFVSMLPSIILSGFVFPIDSMPPIIQIITNLTPVKFYLNALRGIMLRGAGFSAVWLQWVYLLVFVFGFLGLSVVANRKKNSL